MDSQQYPVFRNPEQYFKTRKRRSVSKCLFDAELFSIKKILGTIAKPWVILDIPSGPGRLFGIWGKLAQRIKAVDFSPEMVDEARRQAALKGLLAEVSVGDAFNPSLDGAYAADLVCCLRFAYYFEAPQRILLMQRLKEVTSGHLLIEYKTMETWKGRRNVARQNLKKNHKTKWIHFCAIPQMIDEIKASGLELLQLRKVGFFSDRVHLLARLPAV